MTVSQRTHLEEIVAVTRASLIARKRSVPVAELEQRAVEHVPRGFKRALRAASADGVAVIAELKKASPSRGLIRADFDVGQLAANLQAAGAAALSVLTEPQFFQGSLTNLTLARAAAAVPCLRKDFIVDEYQVVEAHAHGADAILLIAAALERDELRRLHDAARSRGLDVLIEVHDEHEAEVAAATGCQLIGVNSRDLKTLAVDLNTAERLASRLPANVLRVAESGISTAADLRRLRDGGYEAFLVGESLMQSGDPGAALRRLLAAEALER